MLSVYRVSVLVGLNSNLERLYPGLDITISEDDLEDKLDATVNVYTRAIQRKSKPETV